MPQVPGRRHIKHHNKHPQATAEHHSVDNHKPYEIQHGRQCRHKHHQQHILNDDSFKTHG